MKNILKPMIVCAFLTIATPTFAHQTHDPNHEHGDEQTIELRDVLSGVGYIVGAFGLFAFWKTRKNKSKT